MSSTSERSSDLIQIRSLKKSDVPALLEFVNALSKEDTYVLLSGETFDLETEQAYVDDAVAQITAGDRVHLVAVDLQDGHERIVGAVEIKRNTANKKRSLHEGQFSISISKQWRGAGLGKRIALAALSKVKEELSGIRLVTLSCFGNNTVGLSFYKSLGFSEWGRVPDGILHRGEYVDHVFFIKEL